MKKLLFLLIFSLIGNLLAAQKHSEPESDFYEFKKNIYERNYNNYEAQYLKHQYEIKAQNIMTAGYGATLLLMTAISIPAVLYEWNLWVVIPCETLLVSGVIFGFALWSQKVEKKAQQINVAKVYEYNINDNYCISVCNHYDNLTRQYIPGLGFNIKF